MLYLSKLLKSINNNVIKNEGNNDCWMLHSSFFERGEKVMLIIKF